MLKVNTLTLSSSDYPSVLKQISSAPKQLYWLGSPLESWLSLPKIAVVGSRKATAYGRSVTHDLTYKLAQQGVVIISGLAFGIDAAAHAATLEAGGITAAVLGNGIDKISPTSHHHLARQIVQSGGTLISEYPANTNVFKTNFVARNRIISGLADGILITEATVNSGSLHTAHFALEQGKTVMAVPGNINSPTSEGCNNLIKSGAIPITNVDDIFFAMNWQGSTMKAEKIFRGSAQEELILSLIKEGIRSQEELALVSRLDSPSVASALTMLEIAGVVRPEGAGNWTLA
jgi:DNA processing protein